MIAVYGPRLCPQPRVTAVRGMIALSGHASSWGVQGGFSSEIMLSQWSRHVEALDQT